jgi:hypothetical protein
LDALSDVDGYSPDVVSAEFDLAGVEPDPHPEAELVEGVADRASAAKGTSGTVEGRHETVAHGVDCTTAESLDLAAYDRVVTVEQCAPPLVALFGELHG